MGEFLEAARILGIDKPNYRLSSDVQYLELISKGLPIKCVDLISDAISPSDRNFKYLIVSKATLARRKSQRTLSPAQSVVVTRLASVWHLALRIWKSSDAARDFLYRPHALLKRRRPIDLVLENELGAELVKNVLGRLEHGTAV